MQNPEHESCEEEKKNAIKLEIPPHKKLEIIISLLNTVGNKPNSGSLLKRRVDWAEELLGDIPSNVLLELLNEEGTQQQFRTVLKQFSDNKKDSLNGIHWVAKMGYLNILKALIQAGVDVNQKTENGGTPLHFAACNGRLEMIQYLLNQGAEISAKNEKEATPLRFAVYALQPIAVACLVESGAKECQEAKEIVTLLHVAFIKSDQSGGGDKKNLNLIIECLLKHGFGVGKQDKEGMTLLHHAAAEGRWRAVASLLERGALVNVRDNRDETPLKIAIQNIIKYRGQEVCVQYAKSIALLILKGADVKPFLNDKNVPDDVKRLLRIYAPHRQEYLKENPTGNQGKRLLLVQALSESEKIRKKQVVCKKSSPHSNREMTYKTDSLQSRRQMVCKKNPLQSKEPVVCKKNLSQGDVMDAKRARRSKLLHSS